MECVARSEAARNAMVEQHELDAEWTLVTDQRGLAHAADALAAASGPVGIDAERASGYRYGSEAYLVQAHRRGTGTFLFDPTADLDFTPLAGALANEEWIIHSASGDLACLEALGLVPARLFDTELASRLLGFERVGLGALVERLLGVRLHKAHSAADWSTRPLPESWLDYAAFDVALLPDLRDQVFAELERQQKTEIARQEFEAVLTKPTKPTPAEPWRKLAGGNRLRTPREMAIARELWMARDELARSRDVAPGRLLPDRSLILAASIGPRSASQLASLREFTGRASRTELDRWWAAILRGKTTDDLPGPAPKSPDHLPNHRGWAQKRPDAAARLSVAKEALAVEAEHLQMPVENLLTPDLLRRVSWEPPHPTSTETIAEQLSALGARQWQVSITAPIIAAAFVAST